MKRGTAGLIIMVSIIIISFLVSYPWETESYSGSLNYLDEKGSVEIIGKVMYYSPERGILSEKQLDCLSTWANKCQIVINTY
jgi:hypothetical protein